MLDKKVTPSFYTLSKTNPKLTGNIKFVVDDENIYIDSIDSTEELTQSIYKSFSVDTSKQLMTNVKSFASLFTVKDSLYAVRADEQSIAESFEEQHIDIYRSGAYSDTSEQISKRFRAFAPIYMEDDATLPDVFSVWVIDRAAYESGDANYFRKLVYSNDLRSSSIGFMLRRHREYLANIRQELGIFANFGEHISTTGSMLSTGLIETRYLDDFQSLFANERSLTEFETYITNMYKYHEMVDPRYINLEFTFDVDLADIDLNDKFLDIVCVYGTLESIEDTVTFDEKNYDFQLTEHNSIINSINVEDSLTDIGLQPDYVKTADVYAVEFNNSNYAPIVMIRPNFIPNAGSKIILSYNGNTQIEYQIEQSLIVQDDIMQTAKNIAEDFTVYARNNSSSILVDAFIHDNEFFVIRSLVTLSSFNNIKVELLPSQYSIIPPVYDPNSIWDNNFYSPGNNNILLNSVIGLNFLTSDSVRKTGGIDISSVNFGARWLDDYFYNLDSSISTETTASSVDIIRTEQTKMYGIKISEMRAFDFDHEISYHTDVFDFDLEEYRAYLLERVNSDDYLGKYQDDPVPPSPAVLAAYKALVIDIINRYFNAIDIERKMLIKSLSTDTFEGTPLDNEYNRLAENHNIQILSTGTINEFVNKWMFKGGLDVYNKPYRLNLNLPFRYDNFAPSLSANVRDLRLATHTWPIIGEGIPPYFANITQFGVPLIETSEVDVEEIQTIDRHSEFEAAEVFEWTKDAISTLSHSGTSGDPLEWVPGDSKNFIRREIGVLTDNLAENFTVNFSVTLTIDLPPSGTGKSAGTGSTITAEIIDRNIAFSKTLVTWEHTDNDTGPREITIAGSFGYTSPLLSTFSGEVDLILRMPNGWGNVVSPLLIHDIHFWRTTIVTQTVTDVTLINSFDVDMETCRINDQLASYTTFPMEESNLLDTTQDAYEWIRSHSNIVLEDDRGVAFIRGLKIVVDKKFVGYKFAPILFTSEAPPGEDRSIKLYVNETFKSLTLVIRMYIPEPVLTSLEIPGEYWLDRSVLYFSDGNYASEQSLIDFGDEPFSAMIHDTSTEKFYLGNSVGNNWYFQDDGQNYVHVAKGDITRFNVDFPTFLDVGDDLEVFFGDIDPLSTVNFGMKIVFQNIQEVQTDYFWCEEINVTMKETDPNTLITTVYNYDVLAGFLADGNIFLTENRFDIVQPILLENARFIRRLRNSSIISRYNLISTAAIFDWLNSNDTELISSDGSTTLTTMTAYEPTVNTAVIRLTESNFDITTIDPRYATTFIRQNGLYEPVTKILRTEDNRFGLNFNEYEYAYKVSSVPLLPSISTNQDRETDSVWFYRKNITEHKLDKYHRYYRSRRDYDTVNWFGACLEVQNHISRVLSSRNTIQLQHTTDLNENNESRVPMYDLLVTILQRYLDNTGYSLTDLADAEKLAIVKVFDETATMNTLQQYDVTDIIRRNLFDYTFSDIYKIDNIVNTATGDLIDFDDFDNHSVLLTDPVDSGTIINITLIRQ